MTVQIARGAVAAAKATMVVVLRLRSAAEPQRVATVLREAITVIRDAYGDNSDLWVSEPMPVDDGEIIVLSRGWWSPPELPGREPALIQQVAERLKLEDGVIDAPRPIKARWDAARHRGDQLWPTARAYLYDALQQPFGAVPRGAPRTLIDISLSWLQSRAEHDRPLRVLVNGVSIPTDWRTVGDLAARLIGQALVLVITADDPTSRQFSAHAPPTVILTGTEHPKAAWIEAANTDGGLVAAMRAMRHYAVNARGIEWGGVTTRTGDTSYDEPDVRLWAGAGGYRATEIRDIAIPDAFWWQTIGPGHIERLGAIPTEAVAAADDRLCAITFGTPEQWLPGSSSRDAIQEIARRVLAPLLFDEREAHRISSARFARARASDTTGYFRNPPNRQAR